MPFKSPFPEVPPLPDQNVHDLLFNSVRLPEKDYVLHVDGLTGEKRTRSEFVERVRVGASALCQPQPEGPGVGGEGEIVGILSHNSLVSLCTLASREEEMENKMLSAASRIISPSSTRSWHSQLRSHSCLPMGPHMNWPTLSARPRRHVCSWDQIYIRWRSRQLGRSDSRRSEYSC